ncbi:MAG TPA: nucleotidyltransferase domain-containing protein [Chloroflexota bacterium]|nr:nucleotidyltransferase domain-containing protein [Chloroflexota bacterium]HUM69652.1 nucleotidyltransferase domain-containing protein [Chloroflexota bacterium]
MEVSDLPFFPTILVAIQEIPELSSIYLIGSAARGEMSAINTANGVELFSDIELLVVTNKHVRAATRKTLFTRMAEIENNVENPNPLFHIDILLREKYRLSQMLPTIFTFELQKNGKLLWGKDAISQTPDIALHNLDFLDANEILYKRLWAILLHIPKSWLTGELSPTERRVAGYVFCRNTLDIPTVLLPQAHILLPTYRERVTKLMEVYPDLPFATLFGMDFPNFLQMCLVRRLDLNFQNEDMESLYARTIHYLTLAISCISRQSQSNLSSFHRGFNERPISPRQWLNVARLGLQMARQRGIATAIEWLRQPKKEILSQGLLAMHLALIAWKNGNVKEAESQLSISEEMLRHLTGNETPVSSPEFPARWQTARKEWGRFWGDFIRLGDPRYPARHEEIIEWQHD